MSSDFRPESQDGYSHDDELLHHVMTEEREQGVDGDYAGYDAFLDGEDEDEPFYDDEDEWDDDYDGQPSEYDEWMDFDPDC